MQPANPSCTFSRVFFTILGLLVLCGVLFGCKPIPGTVQPKTETSYSVKDIRGRHVLIPQKPSRVVTLSMGTDEIVLGLLEPEKVAAVNVLLDDPVNSNITEIIRQIPHRIGFATIEEIVSLRPDLLIVPDWGDDAFIEAASNMGIPVVVVKGARSHADICETITLIAAALGEETRGEKLLAMMEERLSFVRKKAEIVPRDKQKCVALISVMVGYGGADTTFHDACRFANVRNGLAEAEVTMGIPLTKERLLLMNPDVLFFPTYRGNGFDSNAFIKTYTEDPAMRLMSAIRDNHIRTPNEAFIYNGSQDFVFGVEEIAYQVYGAPFEQPLPNAHLQAW